MRTVVLTALLLTLIAVPCRAAIVLDSVTPSYSQNFNSLDPASLSSVTPADWSFSESGTGANTTYDPNNGSSAVKNTYSYGNTPTDTDRAFGLLRADDDFATMIGAQFSNGFTVPIIAVAISYTGEEWRLQTAGLTDRLDFQYSTNATSLTTGTWLDWNPLDFTTPNTAGPGMKNGDLAENRTDISSTITGLSIPASSTFWIRWTDLDLANDDGLAVDDFTITAAVPEPGAFLFGTLVCGVIGLGFGVRGLIGRRGARRLACQKLTASPA